MGPGKEFEKREEMHPALFYHNEETGVRCELCPQNCLIHPGRKGFCRARENKDGVLYTLNYNRITGLALDPIEKKPLYHFFPGSRILSIGTFGCNLACPFCQNWEISHATPGTKELPVPRLLELAEKTKDEGGIGVAFTYSEPGIWFEYVKEAASALKEAGQKTVMVTNGYLSLPAVKELLSCIDAWNIDLKSIRPEFYREVCKGKLEPVLATIEAVAGEAHVEVTNLIIPGLNDSVEEIGELADWLAGLSPDIPLHFSRYYPVYRMNREPTPEQTLINAREIARKKMKYVYLGNVRIKDGSATRCPGCGEVLIERDGYTVVKNMKDSKCEQCGQEIPVVLSK